MRVRLSAVAIRRVNRREHNAEMGFAISQMNEVVVLQPLEQPCPAQGIGMYLPLEASATSGPTAGSEAA